MNKYTFGFYPNGNLAEISVIADSEAEAEKLIRSMIKDVFFTDGLFINDIEPYKG